MLILTQHAQARAQHRGAKSGAGNREEANHMNQSNPRDRKWFKRLLAFAVAALLLVACAPESYPKQHLGTLAGAAAGAYAGTHVGKGRGQLAATAAGTLLGAMIGGDIGRSLDRADILFTQRTSPPPRLWSHRYTGTAVPPPRVYYQVGSYCREFHETVRIGGRFEEVYGIACRQWDGSWMIVQ